MGLEIERHFTPEELGKVWHFSGKFVRDLFYDEPGVLKIDRPETRTKRSYTTLRIPESIATKVHQRLRN